MKIKKENLKQSCASKPKRDAKVPDVVLKTEMFSIRKFKSSLTLSFKFCFCVLRSLFLASCLLASFANAEISSVRKDSIGEQLDPIDFLTSHLALTSQSQGGHLLVDVNTPNIAAETLQCQGASLSGDANTPDVPWTPDALFRLWEPPMQFANAKRHPSRELQSGRQVREDSIGGQLQISDIADVNSATEATWPSELTGGTPLDRKEPLAHSAEGEVSFLTQWPEPSALAQNDSKKRSQLPQGSLPIAQSSNNHLAHQLWQASISIAKVEKAESKNELQRIIEQIRSVEFEPRQEVTKTVIVVEPAQTTEPNETSSAIEAPQEHEKKKIELKLPYEPVTEQTLQILKSLLQHPERLRNPFELGEILFLSGHLKDAAICYQEALSRSSPEKTDPAQNRVWTLFQIGNCLRDDEPPTAMKMYSQLIAEYPDSPWADLAKARSKLIDWYQKDNPRVLIAESQY